MNTKAIIIAIITGLGTIFQVNAQSLNIQMSTSNPSCSGYSNGEVVINITSGTAPFTVNGNACIGNQFVATGLNAGNYTFLIEDATGLSSNADINLVAPAPLNMQAVITNASAVGAADGSIDLTVPVPVLFSWTSTNGSVVANQEDQSGLLAGAYDVAITEANGCVTTKRFDINQPISNIGNFFNPNLTISSQNGTDDDASAISVYPNPSNGRVNLVAKQSNQSAYVLNDMGVRVHTCSVNAEGSVEGIDLVPGTYTLVVTDQTGKTNTKRIMVR